MVKFAINIIVEGNEENTFFELVKEFGTNEKFLLEITNAEGSGNIGNKFLCALREEIFDCIICVYDVDNKAKEEKSSYNLVRKDLKNIFGEDSLVDEVSFCSNPNILQYFLLFCDSLDKVALRSTSKVKNTCIVHKYWPEIGTKKKNVDGKQIKPDYDALDWQLDIMKYSIVNGNYNFTNIFSFGNDLPLNYKENLPSGNLLPMLNALKNGDSKFFERISKLTDSCNYF